MNADPRSSMALGGPTAIGALHAEATLQHSAKRFPNPCHRHLSLQIVLQTGLDCRWPSVCLGSTPPPASNPACMNKARADSVQHGVCAASCVCGICQLGKECADFLTSLCLSMPNQVQAQWSHTSPPQCAGIKAERPHAMQLVEKRIPKSS